ncbi:MAG: hypothetical protein ACYC1Z_07440 [Georgenia sp.]
MPGADRLPPEAYAWWVPALGVALLTLVAAWYLFVRWYTGPRRDRAPQGVAVTVRQRYAAEVQGHLARYDAGEYDLRALHLALSATMRAFASARIGTDVRAWTRGDIAGHDPTRRIGHLLALWEEPSFASRSDAVAATSAARAREVIQTW